MRAKLKQRRCFLAEKGLKWRFEAAHGEGFPGMGVVEDYHPHRAFCETV
jgi:hypothetical protein